LLTRRRVLVLAAGAAAAAVVAGAIVFLNLPRPYDKDFDTRIAEPAHRQGGPVVLYDEGHLNAHTADAGYRPLAELIRSDGYDLRVSREAITEGALRGVSVLVIVLARGANDANDDPAFAATEVDAVDRWVRGGGSLLLVTDHWPYGASVATLGERLGVQMSKGLVEDPEHHDPIRGTSHLVFSTENGLLKDHAIVRGRRPDERVDKVLTFTGQSLLGPAGALALLTLADTATDRPPGPPSVEKKGGDVRVTMEYGDPLPAAGRAQGLVFELERGRVVVLGEAGMLRAQRERDGHRVGMNVPGFDNRQLAINIMRWLSRVL
jgi:hypothetical protein